MPIASPHRFWLAGISLIAVVVASTRDAHAEPPAAPPLVNSDPIASANANANAHANAAEASIAIQPPAIRRTGFTRPQEPERKLLFPIVLAGTGIALVATGAILIAAAPKNPDGCDANLHTCVRAPGQNDDDFSKSQERAGRAHTMPIAGWLTIGLGGMLITAGGLTYLFGTESRHHRSGATTPTTPTTRVLPFAGADGGGLAAVGTF